MREKFRQNIVKIVALLFVLLSFTSCEDTGCVSADDFGATSTIINSNPPAVFGNYPNQSTEWIDTGLRSSGGSMRIAITGEWAPWEMVGASQSSLRSLQSCLGSKNLDLNDRSSNNFGLCAKRVPVATTAASAGSPATAVLKVGAGRVNDLNPQNCICYRGEVSAGVPTPAGDVTSPTNPSDPDNATCEPGPLPNGASAEGQCVFHYTLADKLKRFDVATGEPFPRSPDRQGSICKFEKGMGLYMGLFGPAGNRQPLRLYHLFAQEEECPIERTDGRCEQDSGEVDASGDAVMSDRTKYIYSTNGIPIYDDRDGNNCTNADPGNDEPHGMREVIKLKIQDSYYRDNFGSYRVEFLSGVYRDDDVLIMEHIVNLVEEVLLGRLDSLTGQRDGGLLRFLYESIIGNPQFVLVVQLMLVLYIAFYGVSVTMGLADVSRKELFMKIFQIGIIFTFVGSMLALTPILNFSDAVFGLLAIPNIIANILLTPKMKKALKEYEDDLASGKVKKIAS